MWPTHILPPPPPPLPTIPAEPVTLIALSTPLSSHTTLFLSLPPSLPPFTPTVPAESVDTSQQEHAPPGKLNA